ncbi:MAG: pirin family protein [Cyanobacteria bacterium]|nr:pirin family protein [Cyanobacteriota bacterium]
MPSTLFRAAERGHTKIDWLESYHTFSFGDYYAPENRGHGPLRVINDDRVKPASGFQTHGHQDMEILSIVLSGQLAHKDSMGNGSIIHPGDVQRMSAGTGVTHSEFNPSETEAVHFLQIWIKPHSKGLPPSYEQTHFALGETPNQWRLIASADGQDGAVTIHQTVNVWMCHLNDVRLPGDNLPVLFPPSLNKDKTDTPSGWLHVAQGEAGINEAGLLEAGDGGLFAQERLQVTQTKANTLLVWFDLSLHI